MSDWLDDEMLERTRQFLATNPGGDKRAGLAGLLDITEYKARQLIRVAGYFNCPTWGTFDLETTKLEGHMGRILCASVLTMPQDEMTTFKWHDYSDDLTEDGAIAVAIRDHIESHVISVGYYSKLFDIPFLNARLLAGGYRKMNSMLHLDAIWGFGGRGGPKIGSKSMKNVAEFLGLESKHEVGKKVWTKANAGVKSVMPEIVGRCQSDVRITWEAAQYVLKEGLLKSPIQLYP